MAIVYSCSNCSAIDCKLWREACILSGQVDLMCWRCLEVQGYTVQYNNHGGSDQVYHPNLGSWVPAVPDLYGHWWGYTSVPIWWCRWWEYLPNKSDDCTLCCGSGMIELFECYKCRGSGRRE